MVFQRSAPVATPLERSTWVCGLCGSMAEVLSSPLHPLLEGPVVIHPHALEAHGGDP